VAARATPIGLLVARSDGRVALLDREDGRVLREWRFPHLPDCRLHAHEGTAALVFKPPSRDSRHSASLAPDGPKVAFFDVDRTRHKPTIRTLGETWPIWTDLIPGPRLVAVWPDRVIVTAPEEPVLSFLPQNGATFRASAIAVYVPCGSASAGSATWPVGEPPPLLIAARDARPHAYDLLTGEEAWAATTAWPSKTHVTALRVHGDLLITMTTDSFDVRDAASGELVAGTAVVTPVRLVSATVQGDFAYGLVRDYPADPGVGRGPCLLLTSVPIACPANRLSTRPSEPGPFGYRLETFAPLRQAVWAGRQLVLVEPNGLRAYTLP
jgi:hypothetical protein